MDTNSLKPMGLLLKTETTLTGWNATDLLFANAVFCFSAFKFYGFSLSTGSRMFLVSSTEFYLPLPSFQGITTMFVIYPAWQKENGPLPFLCFLLGLLFLFPNSHTIYVIWFPSSRTEQLHPIWFDLVFLICRIAWQDLICVSSSWMDICEAMLKYKGPNSHCYCHLLLFTGCFFFYSRLVCTWRFLRWTLGYNSGTSWIYCLISGIGFFGISFCPHPTNMGMNYFNGNPLNFM